MNNIQIIKSNRKSIAVEIKKDLTIIVRAPYLIRDKEIHKFVDSKKAWIEKHIKIIQERNEQQADTVKFTDEEIKEFAAKALEYIPQRVSYFALKMGITYGRITIRNQVSRWGSCSAKGNLNFNCLLMLTPTEVIDYVVVHELCHIKEMNHSPKFWNEVEKILPNYKTARKWLKDNGSELINRLRAD